MELAQASVVMPAPTRIEPVQHRYAAPVYRGDPATTSTLPNVPLCASGGARRQVFLRPASRQQLGLRRLRQRSRDADVHDLDASRVLRAGQQVQTDLAEREGNRLVGSDGVRIDRAGVCIQPRRQVDGDQPRGQPSASRVL